MSTNSAPSHIRTSSVVTLRRRSVTLRSKRVGGKGQGESKGRRREGREGKQRKWSATADHKKYNA
eukprot:10186001-Karenia_brevis.AAC.1